MKIGAREIALLGVGFALGAVVTALVTPAVLRLVQNASTQSALQADTRTQRCFDTLLAATAANDYDRFVSVTDDVFRSSLTPGMFQSISQSLVPRMQAGCTLTYLGQFQQRGGEVSLWRLGFADGAGDRLARMSMAQDRVNGFLITPAF